MKSFYRIILSLFLVLISETTKAQTLVTPEQTEIEWNKIEKKVRSLMKKNEVFNNVSKFSLFPIFWVYCSTRDINSYHLHFTYFPRKFPDRLTKYAKCSVLISENGKLVGIGDATAIYRVFNQEPYSLQIKMLEKFLSREANIAFYIGTNYLQFDKIYYLYNQELKCLSLKNVDSQTASKNVYKLLIPPRSILRQSD